MDKEYLQIALPILGTVASVLLAGLTGMLKYLTGQIAKKDATIERFTELTGTLSVNAAVDSQKTRDALFQMKDSLERLERAMEAQPVSRTRRTS